MRIQKTTLVIISNNFMNSLFIRHEPLNSMKNISFWTLVNKNHRMILTFGIINSKLRTRVASNFLITFSLKILDEIIRGLSMKRFYCRVSKCIALRTVYSIYVTFIIKSICQRYFMVKNYHFP